jgi:hypothetical protein
MEELPIFANQFIPEDLGFESSRTIHTSADKYEILQQQRRSQPLIESLADPNLSTLFVYVGDSSTDFDCLLEANIGIMIQDDPLSNSQRELQETLQRVGVEIVSVAARVYAHEALSRPRVYVARNLREIFDFLS